MKHDKQEQTEQWAKCKRFPKYEVSNCGQVRNKKTQHIKRVNYNKHGYAWVAVCRGAEGVMSVALAPLVAAAFIGPRPKGLQINHMDCDKSNNHVSNLEYMTQSENVQHAYAHGCYPATRVFGSRHLNQKDYDRIRALYASGIPQTVICLEFGVSNSAISKICSNPDAKPRVIRSPEEIAKYKRARTRRNYTKHRVKKLAAAKARREANPEKYKAMRKKSYAKPENRAKRCEANRRWRLANPDKVREIAKRSMAKWKAAHPEKYRELCRIASAKRRARRAAERAALVAEELKKLDL